MKPVDVKINTYVDSNKEVNNKDPKFKINTYIDANKEVNNKDPKFKVGNHVRISKYKNIFAKGCTPN